MLTHVPEVIPFLILSGPGVISPVNTFINSLLDAIVIGLRESGHSSVIINLLYKEGRFTKIMVNCMSQSAMHACMYMYVCVVIGHNY